MLRACTIFFLEKWDDCLKLAKFSYNNSYQESIRMAPFEALYGKKCRTPLNWVEVGDHGYFGLDFIVGLPRTSTSFDSIWVIVDHLTKSAHFLPVDTRYTAKKYAEIYFDRIVTLHGVPLTIISDRGSVFVSRFWEQLQECLGTSLLRSSAYHPQTEPGAREHVESLCHFFL